MLAVQRGMRRRLGRILLAVGLALVGPARLGAIAVPLAGCGGCLDASRARNLAVTPPQSCLTLAVKGLCYGAGLTGTNACADPLVIATENEGTVTVSPGATIDIEPAWHVTTDRGTFSSTEHYSIDATLGGTPIAITFDY